MSTRNDVAAGWKNVKVHLYQSIPNVPKTTGSANRNSNLLNSLKEWSYITRFNLMITLLDLKKPTLIPCYRKQQLGVSLCRLFFGEDRQWYGWNCILWLCCIIQHCIRYIMHYKELCSHLSRCDEPPSAVSHINFLKRPQSLVYEYVRFSFINPLLQHFPNLNTGSRKDPTYNGVPACRFEGVIYICRKIPSLLYRDQRRPLIYGM
jgi:hypothetical protein